jgi:type IV pilus assembly protein PilA
MLKRFLKNEKGLTLIELLAVIVILGIVAAIAVPSIMGIIQKSKVDTAKSDAIQIINSAKTFVAANGNDKGASMTITEADLKSYVDKNQFEDDGYTVAVTQDTTGKSIYSISTGDKAIDVGSQTLKLTNATIDDLKAKSAASVTITNK